MAITTAVPYRDQWATMQLVFAGPGPVSLPPIWDRAKVVLGGQWELPQPAVDLRRVKVVLTRPDASDPDFIQPVIQGGPYDGIDAEETDKYITAYKINLHLQDQRAVTTAMYRPLQFAFRDAFNKAKPSGARWHSIQARRYGQAFSRDWGVPAVPRLPPERVSTLPVVRLPSPEALPAIVEPTKPIWPWLVGGAAVLFFLSRMGK